MQKNILFVCLLLITNQLQAYDFEKIGHQHILPGYQKFAVDAVQLDISAKKYCEQPDEDKLNSLRAINRQTFLTWQAVQHLRFGPVQFLSRDSRIHFWPDQRGVIAKHYKKLLEEVLLNEEKFDISEKSIALQGLSALEYLLYKKLPPTKKDCVVIVAITENLQTMAQGIVHDWTSSKDPYLPYFIYPGTRDHLIYETEQELVEQIVNSIYTELEFIVTKKLAIPLGDSIEKSRGRLAEGSRSMASLSAIAANLKACRELYMLAFASELSNYPLNGKIKSAFDQAQHTLVQINMPLKEAVRHAEQRVIVEQLLNDISLLKKLISTELTQELDLTLGFNALDGD